jgi:hypothetical protein
MAQTAPPVHPVMSLKKPNECLKLAEKDASTSPRRHSSPVARIAPPGVNTIPKDDLLARKLQQLHPSVITDRKVGRKSDSALISFDVSADIMSRRKRSVMERVPWMALLT